jgi:hypothetical protein
MTSSFILNGNNLSIFLKGRPYNINNAHPNFKKIVAGLRAGIAEDKLAGMIQANAKQEVAKVFGVEFKDGGGIFIDGEPVSEALGNRYCYMVENDFPLEGFRRFIQNLSQNPSRDSRTDLYNFLEACTLPITDDGCFLAYKRVNQNYTDCFSRTFDNHVGRIVEMPRNKVDADREKSCSTGLHVCSREYLDSFPGGRIMVVKVNPKDVVSVPTDYNNAKMRVCRYEVVSELKCGKWDGIQDMAVKAEEPVTLSGADEKAAKGLNKDKTESNKKFTKAEKWDDYIKTRNIPEDMSELHGNPRKAFIKFCARLRDGSEKAGDDICKAKTASEIRQIILGY